MAEKDVQGKLVLITGGARGIGRATALEFLRAGARVVIADVDLAAAEATRAELARYGEIFAEKLDVSNRAEFDEVVLRVERARGPIEVLVNNAGVMLLGKLDELDEASQERQLRININGVLNGMRAVVARMRERGHGHVVNIASYAGRVGMPRAVAYSASKFAVIGATESARYELRSSGIDFSYVCPYFVNTELISGTQSLRWPPVVQPSDVAKAVVRAVRKREVEVYVPRIGRFLTAVLPAVLPRRVVDLIGAGMGLHSLFSRVDDEQRSAYLARAARAARANGSEAAQNGQKTKPSIVGS